MDGGTISSGRARDARGRRGVLDQLHQLVLEDHAPGRAPRLRPTSKRASSLWLMRFFCTSPSRLARPRVRLSPCVAIAWRSASGLVAAKLAGLSASIHCRAAKRSRSFAARLELAAFHQVLEVARSEQIGLPEIVVIRVVEPLPAGEAPVAGPERRSARCCRRACRSTAASASRSRPPAARRCGRCCAAVRQAMSRRRRRRSVASSLAPPRRLTARSRPATPPGTPPVALRGDFAPHNLRRSNDY